MEACFSLHCMNLTVWSLQWRFSMQICTVQTMQIVKQFKEPPALVLKEFWADKSCFNTRIPIPFGSEQFVGNLKKFKQNCSKHLYNLLDCSINCVYKFIERLKPLYQETVRAPGRTVPVSR